jgi:hypothetical protein
MYGTCPSVYGKSAEFGKSCLSVLPFSLLMNYFRYDGNQEWVCPHIILPDCLAKCKVAFDEFAARAHPRQKIRRETTELFPVFSECRVELFFNKKTISITCDAVVATIMSLFETEQTVVRQSEIEEKTGVKGMLLSAVMEQLCMKRQQEGMATGLLQVPYSFHCAEFVSTHAPCF